MRLLPILALQVILLGTGYPRPDPDRAGPSTAVIAGGKLFIVDAGRGVMMRLAATGSANLPLAAVFLTHLHSDHTVGLPDLFYSTWGIYNRNTPLPLYGPPAQRRWPRPCSIFSRKTFPFAAISSRSCPPKARGSTPES